VLVYVTADELAEMRREAKRQHLSLSRYAKRRLMLASDTDDAIGEPAAENRVIEVIMKAVSDREARLADNLRTIMVMIDNLALSTFTQAAGGDQVEAEKRYRGWQESTLREVRGELANGNANDAHGHHNGDGV